MALAHTIYQSFNNIYQQYREEYLQENTDYDNQQGVEALLFLLLKTFYVVDEEDQHVCSFSKIPSDSWVRNHIQSLLYDD